MVFTLSGLGFFGGFPLQDPARPWINFLLGMLDMELWLRLLLLLMLLIGTRDPVRRDNPDRIDEERDGEKDRGGKRFSFERSINQKE